MSDRKVHTCVLATVDQINTKPHFCTETMPCQIPFHKVKFHYLMHYLSRGTWNHLAPKPSQADNVEITAYVCNICGKTFNNVIKKIHEGWRGFLCHYALEHGKIVDAMKKESTVDMSQVLDILKEEDPLMKNFIEEGTKTDGDDNPVKNDWSVMPEEIVLILFKFLKPGDLLATSQTCQLWRELGENDKLWQQICKKAGLAFTLTPANLNALELRNKNSTITYSAWKENFLKPYKIAKKFREGTPQMLTVEVSHIVDKIKLFNDKIVSVCAKTIYVFCALSGKLLHELVGHTENVEVIDIDKQFIVSASRVTASSDGSVKVWDVDTGSCLHTLLSYGVRCLQIHGTLLVTGSLDGTLRMWDLLEGRNLRTFTGDIDGGVDHIQFDGRFVVSSSGFFDIKVWDPDTGVCLRTLVNPSKIKYFKLNGGHVLSVHSNGTVKVWEVDTGVLSYTLKTRVELLQGDLVVYTGWLDRKSAKICSISTGACLHTLAGHQKQSGFICGIGMNDKFVVTSSSDGKLELWDIKTGLFTRELFVMKSGERVEKMEMKEAKIMCVVRVAKNTKLLVLNFDTNGAVRTTDTLPSPASSSFVESDHQGAEADEEEEEQTETKRSVEEEEETRKEQEESEEEEEEEKDTYGFGLFDHDTEEAMQGNKGEARKRKRSSSRDELLEEPPSPTRTKTLPHRGLRSGLVRPEQPPAPRKRGSRGRGRPPKEQ